ncbi:STAS domain-containing protein [Actinoplanes sp. DH11]|uniref:STAS domain-containing protein n=1 Tax=Actinoplanes sp. DH11 TaxID=2857011 RepID=UPI001E2BEE39|nr:STAS domain-containing protein [Actinoplanes sp. DH11]
MNRSGLTVTSADVTADVTVINIVGELDIRTEELVRAQASALWDRGRAHLVFDMAGLTFCDSTGMGTFIDLAQGAREQHGWIRLAALKPFVLQSFHLLHLDQVLDLYDTTDNALT